MTKVPREVAGFIALPVTLKGNAVVGKVKHFIYLKPHAPRIPDEDTARSLFLVNTPIATTDIHLRHLFATQLDAGRVESVDFTEEGSTKSSALIAGSRSNRKRKRQTADELESALDVYHLPSTFPSDLHASGSSAIVTFVDRPSMELSLEAARRAAKSPSELVWGSGLEATLPSDFTGRARYEAQKTLQYPPRASLLSIVDSYMTGYSALEAARSAENARKRAAPDEDGFVTVTRGSKGGVLRRDETEDLRAKQKAKEKGLEDFYRFQKREQRKAEAEKLRLFPQTPMTG